MKTKDSILIITSSYDRTIDYIIKKYNNIDFFRYDTDHYANYNLTISNDGWTIKSSDNEVSNKQIKSIYYRKPSFPNLDQYEPLYHHYMQKEIFASIDGIVEAFQGNCLTKPSILRRAENKILQLYTAEEIGFETPRSLISNSNLELSLFSKKKQSIVKPLSMGRFYSKEDLYYVQTNMVEANYEFCNLELSPIYMQEYIPKDYEIRLTFIDNNYFGVKIESSNKVDWRASDSVNNYVTIQIPDIIIEKCRKLLTLLNLQFGAFDFIVSRGQYIFLEVNPNGQWGWLEENLNLDISLKIINFLCGEQYE